ncbi:purine/pyrimidine permease [Candidatus Fermentibacterales bacterium]|nr:purine/pyrimidine permease [Candidatus Fermentibacterales bacterium]
MSRKTKYTYGVDEVPPPRHLFALSLQHVMLMFMSLGLPILFCSQINASPEVTAAVISFSMLASGIGSMLQSLRLRYLGCGYLCPNVCGPSYFSLSLSAAWVGGIPLMRGMIIIAGMVEMLLAPVVQRLKRVFPAYVVGLVVAMVGVSVIESSVSSLFGLSYRGDAIGGLQIVIGFASLLAMILLNVWGRGPARMYCLLIGMVGGWLLSLLLVPECRPSAAALGREPFFALPSMPWGAGSIAFSPGMLLPFVIIAISGSLKSFGNLLAAQRISTPDLEKADFLPIRNGLLTDGFTTALAGFFGAMAVDTSSSNVGLAGSTGVLSRWLATAAGAMFCLFAFFPRFSALLSQIPRPVLGASIIFAGCFMVITGLQEMLHEKWDPRKTFVIGVALFMGLSTGFLPELYARSPRFIQSFFTDPLPTATIVAVVMHQVVNLDELFRRKRPAS